MSKKIISVFFILAVLNSLAFSQQAIQKDFSAKLKNARRQSNYPLDIARVFGNYIKKYIDPRNELRKEFLSKSDIKSSSELLWSFCKSDYPKDEQTALALYLYNMYIATIAYKTDSGFSPDILDITYACVLDPISNYIDRDKKPARGGIISDIKAAFYKGIDWNKVYKNKVLLDN